MINELAELIEMYELGTWSRGDYFHRITLLVPTLSVGELLHELPSADRDDFVRWMRETYDNDVPADHFVSIGYRDDAARSRERIDSIREWLRESRRVGGPR